MKKMFCARLRQARGARSQKALAGVLGISQQNWQRYETGVVEPSIEQLHDICVKLSVSADWLLGLGDGPAPAAASVEACAECAKKDAIIAHQAAAIRDISAAAARMAKGFEAGRCDKPTEKKTVSPRDGSCLRTRSRL